MGERGNPLHSEHQRITRAQPHRSPQVLDRYIRFAATKRSNRSAGVPGGGQIRVQRERSINEREASLNTGGRLGLHHEPDVYEFSVLRSSSSSARRISPGGISSPSALAVLRLTTISSLVGCSTGSSAGCAPLRLSST